MLSKKVYYGIVIQICCFLILFPSMGNAAQFKVLVVMSYDEVYEWVKEIREGIDLLLKDDCDVRYFYMDTKKDLKNGPRKAKEAFALYEEFQPDGVIAADDNAQSMFVVPYLKDKVGTPVMFCGVNAEAASYGYPASNVSGILEHHHIRESIAFVQQLVPSVKTIGYIQKKSPSAEAMLRQIQKEANTYPAEFIEYVMPETLEQALAMTTSLREKADVLFIETLHGLPDEKGVKLPDEVIVPMVVKAFGKPTTGANLYHVKNGVLCAMIKTGQEQGKTAAKMLLKAMQGMPVSEIPIVRNHKGKAVINITTMRTLKVIPQPAILKGVEFVR